MVAREPPPNCCCHVDACTYYTSSIEPENDRVPRTIESENDRAREHLPPRVGEYQAFSGHARNLAYMAEYIIRAMPQTVFSGDAALFLHDVLFFLEIILVFILAERLISMR